MSGSGSKEEGHNLSELPEGLKMMCEGIEDGVLVLAPEKGTILFVNAALARLFHCSEEALTGMTLTRLFDLRDAEPAGREIKSTEAGGLEDLTCLRPDGSTFRSDISISLMDYHGRSFGVATVKDASERRQAEEFRAIAESGMDALLTCDMDGRILEVNQAYCRLTGSSRDELLERMISDLEVGQEPGEICARINRLRVTRCHHFVTRHRHRDGTGVDVEASEYYLDREGGRCLLHLRDITRHRAGRESSQKEGQLHHDLLWNLPQGFALNEIITDKSGKPVDYRILKVNKCFESITGFAAEEVAGRRITEVINGRDKGLAEWICLCGKVALEGREEKLEIHHPDQGRSYSIHIYSSGNGLFSTLFNDITGRRNVENKLSSARFLVEHLFRSSRAVIFSLEPGGDFLPTCVSENISRVSGYTREEFLARTDIWQALIHPQDRERVLLGLSGAFEKGEQVYEYRMQFSDGLYHWVRGTLIPVSDAQGNPMELTGSWVDINDQKQAHREPLGSREVLQVILDSMPGLVCLRDREGRLVLGNRAFNEMLGKTEEEIAGRPFSDLVPSWPAEHRRIDTEVIESGSPKLDFELRLELSGQTRWFMTNSVPWENACGDVIGVMSYSVDVTGRKLAEKRLVRKSTLLDAVNRVIREALTCRTGVEVAEVCLTVAEELTGSRFGFIGELNPQGRFDVLSITNPGMEACAISREEARRRILDMEVRGVWAQPIIDGRTVAINDPPSHPSSVGTPEGHPPVLSYLGVPLKRGEEVIGLIGLANREGGYTISEVEDIETLSYSFVEALNSKRREEEVERHHTRLKQLVKDLEWSNEELRQFAYVASHDLQEPLRMVDRYTELLSRRYRGTLDPEADEFIELAVDGARRMKQLINDLLNYSRVDASGRAPEPTECSAVLHRALHNLQLAVEESGAELTCDPLPVVTADGTQLVQLFQNLIGNAIKFCDDEPPQIAVSASLEGDSWLFSVKDNGIGFEPAYAERVFSIFQRLHNREEYTGTGIGLAICRKIVERHGGRIWAESVPGEGSIVYFTIPKQKEPGE